ncbi:MAG TPA: hypothetical protein VJ436_13215 [Anaerolineales bacterium]|nr:hypothetical protein [Anaerolineales bacterium]
MTKKKKYVPVSLGELRRLARLLGASRVHVLHARQEAIFYFVNPECNPPALEDQTELHLEFQSEALLFLAVFPIGNPLRL